MRVIIREGAYGDLSRIYEWIAKDRPRAADFVIDRILRSIERLGELPYIGHAGRAAGTYEWVVTGLPYISWCTRSMRSIGNCKSLLSSTALKGDSVKGYCRVVARYCHAQDSAEGCPGNPGGTRG
jgi:plasmid stabilization system protein ParE